MDNTYAIIVGRLANEGQALENQQEKRGKSFHWQFDSSKKGKSKKWERGNIGRSGGGSMQGVHLINERPKVGWKNENGAVRLMVAQIPAISLVQIEFGSMGENDKVAEQEFYF